MSELIFVHYFPNNAQMQKRARTFVQRFSRDPLVHLEMHDKHAATFSHHFVTHLRISISTGPPLSSARQIKFLCLKLLFIEIIEWSTTGLPPGVDTIGQLPWPCYTKSLTPSLKRRKFEHQPAVPHEQCYVCPTPGGGVEICHACK